MADRVDVTLEDVLDAFLARLRSELGLNDRTCFLWLQRSGPPPPVPDDVFITVEPDGGTFDAAMITGGGANQVTVETTIGITIHSLVRLDPGGRDAYVLQDSTRGIMPMLTSVLRALVSHDLLVGGNQCLRELLMPTGFERPQRLEGEKRATITVVFNISFDWDMTA